MTIIPLHPDPLPPCDVEPLVAAHDPRPFHATRRAHIVHGILALFCLAAFALALGCAVMDRCDYLWSWWTQ